MRSLALSRKTNWFRARAGLGMALALAMAGCGRGGAVSGPSITAGPPIYRLAPDDKVRINVYGEEGLTGTFVIGSNGELSYPLLGAVKAAGLSVPELQAVLTNQLRRDFVKDAKVSIDIAEYRPFFVLGEVNRPGQYAYRVGLTVNAAVATAGGFSYRANHKVVAIQHLNQPGEVRYRLDPSLQVLPGDTVRVLERFF